MPWRHTSPMDQKTQLIADYLRDRLSVTELCELYGVSPTDPAAFVAIAALLTLVALAASFIPARRAARVDPLVAFKYE